MNRAQNQVISAAVKFSTRTHGTNPILVIPASVPISASVLPENNQNSRRDVKRNPSTPDKGAKAAAIQCQKKPCRNVATDPTKQHPVIDMGMFFFTRNNTKAIDIFPKDLPTKICAGFTCKGRECSRESCLYSHPRNACKLPAETIAAIAHHFSTKKMVGSTNGTS